MSDRVVVVAGLIVQGGRVLVSQRGGAGVYAGFWEFPGGKVESGEDDRSALRRELREELGIDVDVGRLVWSVRTTTLLLRFLVCDYPWEQRPRPLECVQFRWLRLEDLGTYRFPPADDGLIAAIGSGRIAGLDR